MGTTVSTVHRHANDELRRHPVLRSVAFGQEVPEQKNSGAVNGPDRQRGSYDNQGFWTNEERRARRSHGCLV